MLTLNITQSINQSINQSTNQSINKSINQSSKQSINQAINQWFVNSFCIYKAQHRKTNDRTPPQTRGEPRCSYGIEFLLNMWHPSCWSCLYIFLMWKQCIDYFLVCLLKCYFVRSTAVDIKQYIECSRHQWWMWVRHAIKKDTSLYIGHFQPRQLWRKRLNSYKIHTKKSKSRHLV